MFRSLDLLYKENAGDPSFPHSVTPEGTRYFGPGLKLVEKTRFLCPKLKAGFVVFRMSWFFWPTHPGRRYFAGPGPRHFACILLSLVSDISIILIVSLWVFWYLAGFESRCGFQKCSKWYMKTRAWSIRGGDARLWRHVNARAWMVMTSLAKFNRLKR
jgi:hypothetical protein